MIVPERLAAGLEAAFTRIRITSYNVCYTKLLRVYVYEAPLRLWHWTNALSITALALTGWLIGSPFVITSYSIHYTKLYEARCPCATASPWASWPCGLRAP